MVGHGRMVSRPAAGRFIRNGRCRPRMAQPRDGRKVGQRPHCQAMPAPIRVLIVDDHPAFRRTARELLELRGHAVVGEADCAAAAYAVVASCEPDLVLLDVGLGPESGFDVARGLWGLYPAPPVLLMSAGDPQDLALVVGAGARGFVPKWRLPSSICAASCCARSPSDHPFRAMPPARRPVNVASWPAT